MQPYAADVIIQHQWATQRQLAEIGAAFKAWGKHPDTFWARARYEAVAWQE